MGLGLSKLGGTCHIERVFKTDARKQTALFAATWAGELEKTYGKVLEWRSSERRAAGKYIILYCY